VEVRVLASAEAVTMATVDLIAAAVARKPDLVVAWPTGRTPVALYEALESRSAAGSLDLSRVRGFNLDELLLARNDARNFRTFMAGHAWWRAGLAQGRFDIPDGATGDPEAERGRYEAAIAAAGGIDLCLLGIGTDGHVAYNMPGPASFPVHVRDLPDDVAVSLEVPQARRPLRAITMGLGTLRSARSVVLLATGESKTAALRVLVHGPEDPQWPCSYLTTHPNLVVLCDRAADPAAA